MTRPLALIAGAALVLAACGGDDTGGDTTGTATAAGTGTGTGTVADPAGADDASAPADTGARDDETAVDGPFPVTIEHKYGTTEIPAEPERVVSVGFSDQDDILALGVTPVGIRDWYGDQPFATWPWARDELGDAEPAVLDGELNFEAIAALDPDLIVGVSSGMTAEDYELLSAIAPTLAQPGEYEDYGTPWQERTVLVGRALGREAAALDLVAEVEETFAAARDEHPEFDGVTAAVAFVFDGQPGAYSSQDVRARVLGDLGFVTPPEFDDLAGDSFYFTVSEEELARLDAEVIVWILGSAEALDAIDSLALRSSLAAAREGREVVADVELSGAFSFASPLSLQYVVDRLVPELAVALDGDPATRPPSASVLSPVADDEAPADTDSATDSATGDDDAAAAADAWSTVFDSTVPFEDKAPHLADAEALRETVDAYAETGSSMGGIGLEPTAVEVDGDTATVTYDVLFGDNVAYRDQTGTLERDDGTWVVGRAEFCGFMASARTPCPSE